MRPRLPHRIDIEQVKHTQDPRTGEIVTTWQTYCNNIPAKVTAMSGRELIAAQAEQSEINARIQVNFDPHIVPTMRAKHRGKIYSFHGVLPDHVTGLRWLTIPSTAGVNDE